MKNSSSLYVIGDVHGCLPSLMQLLDQLDPDIPLVFTGDIINRGPNSLGTLRFIKSLGSRALTVLGNHDLHLLATAAGFGKPNRLDTINEILQATDCQELIDWLRFQPLLYQWQDWTIVHAGLLPAWSLDQAQTLAQEVQSALRSPTWKSALSQMYGKEIWDESLKDHARRRAILNALTRIRLVTPNGMPDYKIKETSHGIPCGFSAWFDAPERKSRNDKIVFGHWSTLGKVNRDNVIALDTGCVWGGALTAVQLPQRHFISVKAPRYLNPLA